MSGEEAAYRAELEKSGRIALIPTGGSMYPTMRGDTDIAELRKPQGRLRRLDIALYARENGCLILHRVLRVGRDDYVMCGDHLREPEYGVTQGSVIGVMTRFRRGGRWISTASPLFRLVSFIWYLLPRRITLAVIRLWLAHKKE